MLKLELWKQAKAGTLHGVTLVQCLKVAPQYWFAVALQKRDKSAIIMNSCM